MVFQKRIVFSGALVILLLIVSLLPIYPSPQGSGSLWTLLSQQDKPLPQDQGARVKRSINATLKSTKEEKGPQKLAAPQTAQTASADEAAAEAQPEGAPRGGQNVARGDGDPKAKPRAAEEAKPEKASPAPKKGEQPAEKPEPPRGSSGLSQKEQRSIGSFLSPFGLEHLQAKLLQAAASKDPRVFGEALPPRYAFFTSAKLPRRNEISYTALDWEALAGGELKWAVLWKPALRINKKFPNRSNRSQIKRLQQMLADLGHYKGRIDGLFGAGTLQAVESFQEKHGLPRTKGPDPRTIFWICVEHERSE